MYLTCAKLKGLKIFALLLLVLAFTASASMAQKSANKGGGGGGGGGGGTSPTPTPTPTPTLTPTPTPTPILPNPLPQTAPAPDILYRESFGPGPDIARPQGDMGVVRAPAYDQSLQGYWIEYPGSSQTQWIAPVEGEKWNVCSMGSVNGVAGSNPYEMFSPLQILNGVPNNGCVYSGWNVVTLRNPTALMPFTAPDVPYEVSLNGNPAMADRYLAVGLTDSAVIYDNLKNSGSVVLLLKPAVPFMNYTILYELRAGGINGTLLASGETYYEFFNQMKLRYDPVAKTVGANVNGTELGTFPLNIGTPRYAGFEGIGLGDNFVIRKLQ